MNPTELYEMIAQEIQERADHEKAEVHDYIIGTYTGEILAPGWMSPLKRYARRIVNAYRETQRIPANPYEPGSTHFKLFDALLNKGWVSAADLKKVARGHVGSYLAEWELRKSGWMLEKDTNGPVRYRMSPIFDKS